MKNSNIIWTEKEEVKLNVEGKMENCYVCKGLNFADAEDYNIKICVNCGTRTSKKKWKLISTPYGFETTK